MPKCSVSRGCRVGKRALGRPCLQRRGRRLSSRGDLDSWHLLPFARRPPSPCHPPSASPRTASYSPPTPSRASAPHSLAARRSSLPRQPSTKSSNKIASEKDFCSGGAHEKHVVALMEAGSASPAAAIAIAGAGLAAVYSSFEFGAGRHTTSPQSHGRHVVAALSTASVTGSGFA